MKKVGVCSTFGVVREKIVPVRGKNRLFFPLAREGKSF